MASVLKLLIANRGEIAVRIARAARDAGITTVAVYADQDRQARFARLANEAYALNGTTPAETYLDAQKILAIARRSGANAVHPGYGFLSENARFAQMVIDEGLLWIGPPPAAIAMLGDKVSARKIAQQVGAPLVPGTDEPVKSAEEVVDFVKRHGLPIAIKAAHGGGGRGLKVARTVEEIPEKLATATSEALTAFGQGDCFVERYLENPRHVETQCLADTNGNVVVVSTRDCSLQRRHQKLVEEAPAPFLSEEQEAALYGSSKAILKQAGYVGAGTCEFLIGNDGTISFLEVNTRLQVEHPVSEEITGIDLVREQFRIAEGGSLDYPDPVSHGHSIEFRINGEDPGRGFLPMPGSIHSIRFPGGPGVRIDSGITAGDIVTGNYDSLLAKLIVTGVTRQDALERARRALSEFEISGIPTVIPFHRAVVTNPSFVGANASEFLVHTSWIETDFENDIPAWVGSNGAEPGESDVYRTMIVEVEGRRLKVAVPSGVFAASERAQLRRPPVRTKSAAVNTGTGSGSVHSPMQATVIRVLVEEGSEVVAGETVCVIEAMKMEQPISAPSSGTVVEVGASAGDTVIANQTLFRIE